MSTKTHEKLSSDMDAVTRKPSTSRELRSHVELSGEKNYQFDYESKGKMYVIGISSKGPDKDSQESENYEVVILGKKYQFIASLYDFSTKFGVILDKEFGKNRKKIPSESQKAQDFLHTVTIEHSGSELIFKKLYDNTVEVSMGKSDIKGYLASTSPENFQKVLGDFLKENHMSTIGKNQGPLILKALKISTDTEFYVPKIKDIHSLKDFNRFMGNYFPTNWGGEGGWHNGKTFPKEIGNQLIDHLFSSKLLSTILKQDSGEENSETYENNEKRPIYFIGALGFGNINSENLRKMLPYIHPFNAYNVLDHKSLGSDMALMDILKVTLSRKDPWLSEQNTNIQPSELERLKRLAVKIGGYKISTRKHPYGNGNQEFLDFK